MSTCVLSTDISQFHFCREKRSNLSHSFNLLRKMYQLVIGTLFATNWNSATHWKCNIFSRNTGCAIMVNTEIVFLRNLNLYKSIMYQKMKETVAVE